jgi:acetyl esterase
LNRLHPEFRALAAARKIIGGGRSAINIMEDRTNAERWIKRFASGVIEAGEHIVKGEHATVIYPIHGASAAQRADMRVLYIHGGGMVYYNSVVFTPLLQFWANTLGTPIEAFDYQKAPEYTLEESISGLIRCINAQLDNDSRPTVLVGDSVGALLALYIAIRHRPGRFAKLVLIYPVLELQIEHSSYAEYGDGYFLDASAMRRFKGFLLPYFQAHGFDPFKLSAEELRSLPPCTLATSGCDVLCDEALSWKAAMDKSDVAVQHCHFDDLPHDFCLYVGKLNAARRAVKRILSTINEKVEINGDA